MNEGSKITIQTLFKKADSDYKSASILAEYKPAVLDTAAFHCQQAIEKYMKAYLVFKEVEFPKIHNLENILALVVATDATFYRFDFLELTSFAVEIRYTDEYIVPDAEEMQTYLKLVEQVKAEVLSKINL